MGTGRSAPNWVGLERRLKPRAADSIARVRRSPARAFRAAAAVVLGAAFALAAAGAAEASPSPVTLTPLVDCVTSAPGAAPDAFTVVFGYSNASTHPVSLTPGAARNTFSLGGDRGQPATFDPGVHNAVFATTFSGAAGDLSWTLGDSTVAIDPSTPSCDTATTVTVSAPATAASGDALDASATVARMLLGAPSEGSVEFTFDSSGTTVSAPVSATGVARVSLDAPGPGSHTLTARYIPPTATPQLLGSAATASVTVTRASAISIASAGLSADGRSARFIVSRTAFDAAARVDYVTADGSARSGEDYASSRGTVRFAAGQAGATIAIPLLDRPFGSPGASFYVLLQRASEAVDVAGATAVLPQVTAVATQPPGQGSAAIGFVQRPQVPPAATVATPTSGAGRTGGAGDLALMVGGLLLTAGAAFGVIGMMRLRSSGDASEV